MQIVAQYFGKWHLLNKGRAPGRILGFGLPGSNPQNRGGTIPASRMSCLNILPSLAQLCFIMWRLQRCEVYPSSLTVHSGSPKSHLEELWCHGRNHSLHSESENHEKNSEFIVCVFSLTSFFHGSLENYIFSLSLLIDEVSQTYWGI